MPSSNDYAICEHCADVILRCPGGIWEHALDHRLNWDHFPEPEFEPLTEADAELEYAEDPWEVAMPGLRQVDTVQPSRTYL